MQTCDVSHRLAFTRVEAAAFLGLSPATIDRLAKRGLLRPSRATRRPLYTRPELERFLSETSERVPVSHRDFLAVRATATKGGE
jgi:hypothetical protein